MRRIFFITLFFFKLAKIVKNKLMAKVVVIGAGISGHTAAIFLRYYLNKSHEVVVINPTRLSQFPPSNIWVAIGRMKPSEVTFDLEKIYKKNKITFVQGKALSIHPEGEGEQSGPFVLVEMTKENKVGEQVKVDYDYLINATGPRLAFELTEGLGPDKYTYSVCTYEHAEQTWKALQKAFKKMEQGEKQKFVIGLGHGSATCQGAAFEFVLNVAFEIRRRGLQEKAEILWLSNEYELGDFGMGGAFVSRAGYITSTKVVTEGILAEYGIRWIKRAGVYKVDENKIYFEKLDGQMGEVEYDFAMLIPAFKGAGLKAFDRDGKDITDKLFNKGGFMKVDADYSGKPYEEWKASDWPKYYYNPDYKNIFAVGIAFAPPHPISKPMKSPSGRVISPAPPRTGMPSSVIGKSVAKNVAKSIKKGKLVLEHTASMAEMGAACVVSAGYGFFKGAAATLTVFPIVQDYEKYPMWGRKLGYTLGEVGVAGHWFKVMFHYLFMYIVNTRPLWWALPL